MLSMELLPNEARVEETDIGEEPFYLTSGNEQRIFLAAYKRRLPLLLKGPTGCGKTRFVEAMAYKLNRVLTKVTVDRTKAEMTAKVSDFAGRKSFLVTVPCHEDLSANDLVGRFFLTMDQGAQWIDGPLT